VIATGAAVAAAGMTPGAATKVFEYNRDNFMEDREQRMKKEFHERKYRVVQGQLWRQDVRDFVSLTEQKMSLYLIINVLLLSFTVTMWVEGQLPETTPDWLVMGYQIASVVAFSYLVLTIWLAMHAAIAAQSYQTRVLTQLVRLPIPTWAELEAARTAGSEFEKVESRQMFRVPFVTGKQEDFVPGHAASDVDDVCPPEESGNTGGPEQVYAGVATDPWGLEQRGDGIYELGCYSGAEVANLRHVKLLRQAAVYWQTYDAFARVSMSVGINQLMLGMSYYILGYAMLEVKAPLAALAGVLAFMGSAEVVARVDLSLPTFQQRMVQLLVAIGPLMSYTASYLWCFHREDTQISEMLAPLAYISNGLALGCMTIFVHVEEQENGAMVPFSFRGVLYLDVFGWLSHRQDSEGSSKEEAVALLQEMSPSSKLQRDSSKPAASAVQYDCYGNSLPCKAADSGKPGSLEDLRYLPGAPRAWDTVNAIEPPAKDFWDPMTFMPPESRDRGKVDDLLKEEEKEPDFMNFGAMTPSFSLAAPEAKDEDIETGHEREAPGAAPWRIFRNMTLVTCIFWICAGAWEFSTVLVPELIDMGLAFEDEFEAQNKHSTQLNLEHVRLQPVDALALAGEHRASLMALRNAVKNAHYEPVNSTWPYPGIRPTGLSCDSHGRHLLVTDGLSAFVALVEEDKAATAQDGMRLRQPTPMARAEFKQVDSCAALLGQQLQDTALSCADNSTASCEAMVLHQQGQRVASCHLSGHGGGLSLSVASSWLSGTRSDRQSEQAEFLMVDPICNADSLGAGCTSVGTSRWRLARLQRGTQGDDLIPLDVTDDKDPELGRPKTMRLMTERYLGVLRAGDKTLELLDLDNGGATSAKLQLQTNMRLESFCTTGDHMYLLGSRPHPKLLRVPLRTALAFAA